MKIRHLLVVAAASAAVADVSAFEWQPLIMQPNLNNEVTQAYQLETMRIAADYGLATTEVMPKWVDEEGNEIIGTLNSYTDPAWGEYLYDFNLADFKSNGEYTIEFPEGMLKNSAGELSDPKVFYCTVEVPELATAMFDDFQVLSVSPDFSVPQGLWDEQQIKINTNHNDAIGLTKLFVTDNTTGESVTISSNFTVGRTLGDASEIAWTVAGSFKFYEGHNYTAEFVFFNGIDEYSSDGVPTPVVSRASYKFTGKVEGYKYSDLTLLSIDPAPLTLTISEPSQAVFTYTFSGPVNVYKAETPMGQFGTTVYPQSCLSSNEDKTVWTLDLSDNAYVKTVDAELVIYIYARDLDGSQLKGDFGEDDNACYVGQWTCDLGAKSIVVVSPQNGETLDRLSEIVVKSESGEEMSYNWGEMTVQNLLGETIGTLVYEGEGGAATEFHFTKWMVGDSWSATPIDIVAEGSYVINFPTGCFVFGEEFSSINSRSLYSGFQITGNLDDTPVKPGIDPAEQETLELSEANPASGSTVESLETIRLTFPVAVGLNGGDVTVYDAANEAVATGYCDYDWDDWDAINVIIVRLNNAITADGVYDVVIPARSIITDNYEEGQEGACTPEIRLQYTIGGGSTVDPQETLEYSSVYPEMGSEVESLSEIVLTFAEDVTCDDFVVNVYSVARGLVATGIGRTDFSDHNRIVLVLDQPIVEAGRYEVIVPNHVIINGDYYMSQGASGICNPEYRLYYTVEPNSENPVEPTEQEVFNYTSVNPESGSTVKSLEVIQLWFPDLPNCWEFDAYLYKADAVGEESGIVATATVLFDWFDDYLVNATFAAPFTEAGNYVFVIPARKIGDEAFGMSDGAQGICNPEIRLNYTISEGTGVGAVSEASVCDVFDLQGRLVLHNASASDIKTLAKGVYVIGGKKVVVK